MLSCSTAPMPKVLKRPLRHCSSCSKVRLSIAYFAWGRAIICFLYFHVFFLSIIAWFHIYMWYLPDITGQILPVYLHVKYHTSHFFSSHFLLLNNASFRRLFRMGESDYLCDNLECRSLSQTKRRILFFLLYLFEERICRVDFPHAFQDSFLIEIGILVNLILAPWCYLVKRTAQRMSSKVNLLSKEAKACGISPRVWTVT